MEKHQILIVEDNLQESSLLAERMADSKMNVIVVHSAREAIEMEKSYQPVLSIVDYYLPDLDGLALVGKLRNYNSKRLIVVFSNESELSTKVSCLAAGADNYWEKPMTYRELKLRITTTLDCLKRETVLHSSVKVNSYLIDLPKHLVKNTNTGELVALTNNETQILRALLSKINTTVDYETLLHTSKSLVSQKKINTLTLKNIVSKLRMKLPELKLVSKSKKGYMVVSA
jgi:DNA-binding response OmpR family regulator